MKVKGLPFSTSHHQHQHHHRRYPYRTVLNLVAGIVLPLLFIRTAFLALDASAICAPISCLGWRLAPRFFGGSGAYLGACMCELMEAIDLPRTRTTRFLKLLCSLLPELGKEVRKAYLLDPVGEGGGFIDPRAVDAAPNSLDDLIDEMAASSNDHLDVKAFVLKTKAMLIKMERKVQLARLRASIYKYLASIGIPKSMHCLTLRLAEEYLINSLARSSLPPPEYAALLTNSSYLHIAILTDNVLAAAVAVSSTLTSSANPDKLVFHIITDKKTYTAMHTWFALHPATPAILEVKGLHQFDWPTHVNTMIVETAEEIQRGTLVHRDYSGADDEYRRLKALKPSSFLFLNYLRIHLPEIFPKLERVILLDDDVVVRHDLSPLWDLDLYGNVIGAVSVGVGDEGGDRHCIGKKLIDYLNFSDPLISSPSLGLEEDQCAWLGGMNIFDLKAWRRTNITQTYQHWLKHNRKSGFVLWHFGSLPPALIAFNGHVHPIDPSWHLSGLGGQMPKPELLQSAAVLHFSGPGKPWLEIGFPELQDVWRSYVNQSDEFISSCRVLE